MKTLSSKKDLSENSLSTNLFSPSSLPRISGSTRVAPKDLATTTASATLTNNAGKKIETL